MQKEYEKAAAPLRQKLEERQATLATMESKAAQAQADIEAAQKEVDNALRSGNESAFATATEHLTRAQTSHGYFTGRAKMLKAEPVLDASGHTEYESKIKAILLADEAAALEKLKKIVTDIRSIKASLDNSYNQADDCLQTGLNASGKEGTSGILGDPRIRQFCHMAGSEFSRMFKY